MRSARCTPTRPPVCLIAELCYCAAQIRLLRELEDRYLLGHPGRTSGFPARVHWKPQMSAAPRVSFVSLGCPKALVDSERIITRLRAEGYEIARKHDGADLVIVNTCGFLDSAKQESLG